MRPNVKMIACVDLLFNYAVQHHPIENFMNITDLAATESVELDRAILRSFLRDSKGSIAAVTPTVLNEMGNLFKVFDLHPVVTSSDDGVCEVYTRALKEERDIIILGGRRVYHDWMLSGFIDEYIIHQLRIFPENNQKHKCIEPHHNFFEDNIALSVAGNFVNSRLLTWSRK